MLQLLDIGVFKLINLYFTHDLLDQTMPVITNIHKQFLFQILFYGTLGYWLFKKKKHGLKIFGKILFTDAHCFARLWPN